MGYETSNFDFKNQNGRYLTCTTTGVTDLFAETVLLRHFQIGSTCRQLSLIRVFQIPVIYPYYSPVLAVFRSENFAGRPHFSGRQTA